MKTLAVLTTTGNLDEARRLATTLIERKLAACAQISQIESVYMWKGALQHDREYRILFKTTEEMYDAVERAIRELHSYELPAIFSLPVDHAFEPYSRWVAENSSGAAHAAPG